MKNAFKFLKIVLSDFHNAAMLAPTSQYAVRKIIKEIRPGSKTVIEYGPGDGVITKEILKTIPKDGKVVAVEIIPEFIQYLKKINDPRLQVIEGDVLKASTSFPKVDAIISGLPFSFFSLENKEDLIHKTASSLNDEGVFIAYQFSLALLKTLKKFFSETKWTLEFRNFPTIMFIMIAKKPIR